MDIHDKSGWAPVRVVVAPITSSDGIPEAMLSSVKGVMLTESREDDFDWVCQVRK